MKILNVLVGGDRMKICLIRVFYYDASSEILSCDKCPFCGECEEVTE